MTIVLDYARDKIRFNSGLDLEAATLAVNDSILTLNSSPSLTEIDNKDIGIEFFYYDGVQPTAKRGFFGMNRDDLSFIYLVDCTNIGEVVYGECAAIKASSFIAITDNLCTNLNADKLDGYEGSYYTSASNHTYSNSQSGLVATTTQEALDEIADTTTTLRREISSTIVTNSLYNILNTDEVIIYKGTDDGRLILPIGVNQVIRVKNRTNFNLTIEAQSNETIDDVDNITLAYRNSSITLIANGSEWSIF